MRACPRKQPTVPKLTLAWRPSPPHRPLSLLLISRATGRARAQGMLHRGIPTNLNGTSRQGFRRLQKASNTAGHQTNHILRRIHPRDNDLTRQSARTTQKGNFNRVRARAGVHVQSETSACYAFPAMCMPFPRCCTRPYLACLPTAMAPLIRTRGLAAPAAWLHIRAAWQRKQL